MTIPEFNMHWSDQYEITASYFYFNHNNFSRIRFFSHYVHEMVVLNLDYNQIDTIDDDALIELKSLETLSLASTRLRFIGKNYFFFLYSLKLLNMTRNEIVFIENDAFCNLKK
jgi:Leucine-rich repeat (LRR) protein